MELPSEQDRPTPTKDEDYASTARRVQAARSAEMANLLAGITQHGIDQRYGDPKPLEEIPEDVLGDVSQGFGDTIHDNAQLDLLIMWEAQEAASTTKEI